MAFFGKEYKFERQENFEEFVKALDMTPEQAASFINYRPSVKFVKNGDEYVYTTQAGDTKKEATFKSGVSFDALPVANKPCNTTFTVEGNTITQVDKFQDGTVLNFKREFNDNELVLTLTSSKWDGVARRYYKA